VETVYVILSWALCGLIVGFVARLLVPGPHPLGLVRTMLLGVVGAFAGGVIYWVINRHSGEPFSFAENAWPGWIFAIIGAVLVLWIYTWSARRSTWRWW
jgi:uncharacterized membrane protein YeaQ/YmgE (transglycosylase-associated protein family)